MKRQFNVGDGAFSNVCYDFEMRKSPSQRPNYVQLNRKYSDHANFSYFEISKDYHQILQAKALRATGRAKQLPYDLAEAAHANATQFFEAVGRPLKTDCKKGCAHCCRQIVTVFPFEAIQIARVLRSNLSFDQLASLEKRMKLRMSEFKDLSVIKNINNKTPCPFLTADSQCSIYENRPLTCRMAHSFSVKRCRQSLQKDRAMVEIPMSLEFLTGVSGIIEAAFEQLPRAKLDGNMYELCSAVLAVFADLDAARKWASGDMSIFKDCVKDDT